MGKRKKRKQKFEPELTQYDITKYAEYIKEHAKEIGEKVDARIFDLEDEIKEEIFDEIRDYLMPLPDHYEWRHDGCPYDFSGEIFEDGFVSLDQTIQNFLENEYTGRWRPTYSSGRGLAYDVYGDDLSYLTREIAGRIFNDTTKKVLEDAFAEEISEDLFDEIMCFHRDKIYYNSYVSSLFFDWEGAVEYLGIGNVKLSDLITDTEN